MAIEVPPARVPRRGVPPGVALGAIVVALVAIVGAGLLGRAATPPAASHPAAITEPSATPVDESTPSNQTSSVTPAPSPACVTPGAEALNGAIARHARPLSGTGFETLTAWGGADWGLVADGEVGFWALSPGRLIRLDASGRMTAEWTFADDAVFGAYGIVAAREGGVWLWGGRSLAWFDGEILRDVIGAPSDVSDVAEGADGSLWAATYRGGVFRWDGRSWTDVCGRGTAGMIPHLAIDARGGVWVAPERGIDGVSHFDGTSWSIPPTDPAWVPDSSNEDTGSWVGGLVAAGDGSVWMSFGGIGRFDGVSWTGIPSDGVDLSGTVSLAVAPDGTVWAATGTTRSGTNAGGDPLTGIHIVHFDGRAWTVYDSADGLPAPTPSTPTITAVAASREGVLAATRDGFYRLFGARWVRVGPQPASAALSPGSGPMLAVSYDEAWSTALDGTLLRFRNGTWKSVPVADWASPIPVTDMARAPDGTVAVATDLGVAVLRGGRWTVLASSGMHSVEFARDGALWVVERPADSPESTVASFRFDGRTWLRTDYPPLETPGRAEIAFRPDGEPWIGSGGYFGSLHRFDGERWVPVFPFGGTQPPNVVGLAAAPDGSLWLRTDRGVARFDGQRWELRFEGSSFWSLSFADDGTLLATGPSGLLRMPAGLPIAPSGTP